jgi:hypothetical protein
VAYFDWSTKQYQRIPIDEQVEVLAPPDVREALDAFRRIVRHCAAGGKENTRLSSAQLFALQQIGDHPNASVNEIAALSFTHQSSISVVI